MSNIQKRRAPSIANLMALKDVTQDEAKAIRKAWKTIPRRADARAEIDRILKTYGVEYLGIHKRSREHVYYCNAGDSYASTIVFHGLSARVQCWADYVERNQIKGA